MPVKKYFSFLLIVAVSITACSERSEEQQAAPVIEDRSDAAVFRNFTLIDGNGQGAVSGAAMIVDEGRIQWIGAQQNMSIPEGAEVVDLSGKYVMPGIIDLHVHISVLDDFALNHAVFTRENVESELRTYASYGVTTVLSQGTEKDLIFDLIHEQRQGRPAESRVYTAGQGIVFESGYGGVTGINTPVASAEDVIRAVEEQSAKGVDVIKLWVDDEFGTMPLMPAEISQAAIETAHRENLRVVAHIFKLEDAKVLARQGIDGFVHGVRDAPIDQEYIDLMLGRNIWQVSSTLSREAAMFAYAEPAPFLDDPFFYRSVPESILQRLSSPEHHAAVAAGSHFDEFQQIFDTAMANMKTAADAGIHLAFGTDSGPPGRFPGFSAHWELQLMVEAGLTPVQAITAATRDSAAFLGAEYLGTLEPSKFADFIVLDANPLVDISNTRQIDSVYIAGQQVYRE